MVQAKNGSDLFLVGIDAIMIKGIDATTIYPSDAQQMVTMKYKNMMQMADSSSLFGVLKEDGNKIAIETNPLSEDCRTPQRAKSFEMCSFVLFFTSSKPLSKQRFRRMRQTKNKIFKWSANEKKWNWTERNLK